MKKIRKLTSLLLVLVMSLALAVPCFAAEPATSDEAGTIYLNPGDTYTDPETGVVISFKPLDSISTHADEIYIVRDLRVTGDFHKNYTCDPDLGNVFAVRVKNNGANSLRALLNINMDSRDYPISAYGSGTLEIWNGDPYHGISGNAAVRVHGTSLDATLNIYEYWLQ